MADKKISQLPKINLISGSEVILPIVHDGTTQKMDVSTFAVFTSQWSATTGSNTFIGNQTITGNTSIGGNLVVAGKLTAQELFTEITSASIIFESGSTIFGNSGDDTHQFSGSISINGKIVGNAPLDFTSQSLNTQTGSQDLVNRGISSVTGSINTTTSSFNSVFLGISSVTGAINTTTSSFDSVFLGISSFTGSLNSLTGSYATTGSNTFRGNQSITGSLSVSAGEFNVTTGSGNMTSSLIFDHTQNDGVTLGLRHNDRLSLADHTFNVNVWAAGVYTTFVRNGTPYSILNVEAFDDNKIYLYRDTRLYNKSLVIDNNLTVQKDVVIGTGSLDINNGEFSITSGSGELTSSLSFTHTTVDPITGDATLALRYRNNDVGPENNAWRFVATDNGVQVRYDQYTTSNKLLFSVSSFGSNFDKLLIWRDARLYGTGLTVDDSLLVKGVITGSLLSTNGVVSSSNQLFELNAFTASVIGQTNTIAAFTSSVNFTTQSLNAQTGSQNSLNTSLGLITSSIYGEITSLNSVFQRVSSTTGSINTTTSSFNSVFSQIGSTTSSLIGITNGLMAFTAALDSTYATDAQLYQLYQATASIHSATASLNTQTGSQSNLNAQIGIATSSLNSVSASLIGITNGLMAFTAALDSTYATDAQLYQLYQATSSIQFATASLNIQTGSQNSINFNISVVTSSIDAHILKQAIQTGSQDLVNLGISIYTGSQNVINTSVDAHILKQATQTGSQDLVNLGISTFTGSLRNEVNLIEAYTASLKGAIEVSGHNINVLGMVTAQQFNVTYVSSSVMYQSGSNKFGNTSDDRHEFTGSVHVTGSSTFNSTAAKVMEVQSGTSTGGYVRFTYNGSSNSIGYIGNSNQLSGLGTVSDLELRADNNLTLTAAAAISTSTPSGSVYQIRSTNGASGDHIFKSYNTNVLKLDGGTNTATFAGSVVSPSFYTSNTTQSIPFTTWTTVFDLNGNAGIFVFSVQLDGQDAADWAASGIVMSTGISSGVTAQYIGTQNDGTYVQTRISGTTFQVYQNGTNPSVTMNVRVFRIG
jgi:hypothetical protein